MRIPEPHPWLLIGIALVVFWVAVGKGVHWARGAESAIMETGYEH
jgi:hypothetical protein